MIPIYLACFLITSSFSLPAPQQKVNDLDSLADVYGDYDESSAGAPDTDTGLGDLIRLGAGFAEGFLGLLSDKDLQRTLGNTVEVGLNVSRAAMPLAQQVLKAVPRIINATMNAVNVTRSVLSNPEVQNSAREVAGVGVMLAQGVGRAASQVPRVAGNGARLAGSVIHAANATAPLVLQGITEFTDQLPLIAGFASAYAEVNAEQTQKVVQTFSRSLSCDLECKNLEESQAKTDCEEKFCKEIEDEYEEFSI